MTNGSPCQLIVPKGSNKLHKCAIRVPSPTRLKKISTSDSFCKMIAKVIDLSKFNLHISP